MFVAFTNTMGPVLVNLDRVESVGPMGADKTILRMASGEKIYLNATYQDTVAQITAMASRR